MNFLTLTILSAVILMIAPSISGLKCYVSQNPINANLTQLNPPIECQMTNYVNATGCVKHISWQYQTVTRACDYSNCGNAAAACTNTTTAGVTTCCCIGDSCNSAYGTSIGVFGLLSVIVGSLFAF